MADRLLWGRLVLAASIVALAVLGALRPESRGLWQTAVLIPASFIVVGLLVLLVPVTAEWEGRRWWRVRDFLAHSNIVWLLGAFALAVAAVVPGLYHASMNIPERALFYVAIGAGLVALLVEEAIGIAGGLRGRPRRAA